MTANKQQSNREKILDCPSYWVEGVNGLLYDSLVNFMEENKMNKTDLAQFLDISKGRISQILNDGEINFSLEKLFEIVLKIGKYPVLEFKDKEAFGAKKEKQTHHFYMTFSANEVVTSFANRTSQQIGYAAHQRFQKQLVLN